MELQTEMKKPESVCCTKLVADFEEKDIPYQSKILKFSGIGNNDVYNISHPFEINGRKVIAGRVEKREVWADSNIVFFEENTNSWEPVNGAPTLKLEDAFVANIGDEIVLGGVEVYTKDNTFNSKMSVTEQFFTKENAFLPLKDLLKGQIE